MHGYTIIKANPHSKHKNPNTTKCLQREKKKKKLNSPETIASTNALTRIVVQYIALTNPPNYKKEIEFELGQSLAIKLVVILGYNLKINIESYFKNLIVELHVLYSLNTYVKFCVNQILFTI